MKDVTCTRVYLLTRLHHDMEVLMSPWSSETHTLLQLRAFNPTLEDVSLLTLLPMFGETKLKYLTAAMTLCGRREVKLPHTTELS